ncbi:hypothetical protein [Aquirufa antheringensis]|uniref:hypothetical protein n=1 Tax=Aquirufa antheringensis TaxID=2516559 RepID=UPI001F9E30F8|nr:hypothetical protein [Pseudarcicella sp. GAP-15]
MKKLIIFLLLLITTAAKAQDSTYVSVELKNGKSVSGQLIHKSEAEVTVVTKDLGKVTLEWSAIKSINLISKEGKGQNTHPTRYFFAPSAIPLKKGDKYYQNALFLVNSFQAGITDHFSIGGGLVVPFALFITPKIGYQVADKVHVGGGILFATSLIGGLNFGVGTVYGSVTYGTKESNLTLNTGLGAYNENTGLGRDDYNWKFASHPMFTLSGMTRVSNKVMLLTENWFFSNKTVNYDANGQFLNETTAYNGILSGGVRILLERSAFDVGFLVPTSIESGAIPYLAYNIKF